MEDSGKIPEKPEAEIGEKERAFMAERIAEESGAFQCGTVDTDQIRFLQEVRGMCEVNTCRQYGKTWVCPPAVGTLEECSERIRHYGKMIVFSVKYDLEDSFDYEGMQAGMAHFKEVCRRIDARMQEEGKTEGKKKDYMILSNEGCDLCKECTYPDAPCRFPERAHGSLEGYGIMVSELAGQAGIRYINGSNTVTYFGGLLIP